MTTFHAVRSEPEIAEVVRLAREIWQEHYVPIIGQAQVDYMLESFQSQRAVAEQLGQAYEYFLARADGQSAGYTAVVPSRSEPMLLLSKLYVHRSVRGRGVGRELLRFVEELCRSRGITRIWLTVNKHNTHSIAWYGRMGFQSTGSLVQDIGGGFVMDDFRLEKAVA